VITQRLVKEMGGDISFHSQPNRGSTFWFHISLDLNPNVLTDGPVTDCLKGCVWPMLSLTPRRRSARWTF
jgi:two-component system sensor histidine kinase BarA